MIVDGGVHHQDVRRWATVVIKSFHNVDNSGPRVFCASGTCEAHHVPSTTSRASSMEGRGEALKHNLPIM